MRTSRYLPSRSYRLIGRTWAALAALLFLACGPPSPPASIPAAGAGDRSPAAEVRRVADEYLVAYAARNPGSNLPGAREDALPDNSLGGLRVWQELEAAWQARLREIDERAVHGMPEWALLGVLRERVEAGVALRVCREALWRVDPHGGWHLWALPDLAAAQPVGTPATRAAALRRWAAVPRYVNTEIENLREGVRQGYTASRALVLPVIQQVDELLAAPIEQSPFFAPAHRDTAAEFRRALRTVIERQIHPALGRFRSFLADEYLQTARETPGLAGLPDGDACWRAQLRRHTTLPITPDQIDSIGRSLLARNTMLRDSMARAQYGLPDGRALSERLETDMALAFGSVPEAVDTADALLARVVPLLPRYFGHLPAGPLAPVIDTATIAGAMAGYYEPAASNGRAARVVLNVRRLTRPPSRVSLPQLVLHEAVPGHHLQWAVQQGRVEAHPLLRHLGGLSAFSEGWATYAESDLAREMGLLDGPLARGRQADDGVWRALDFLVSGGLHAHGWSVEQAVDTFRTYVAIPEEVAREGVLYFLARPAHNLAYPVGAVEMARLRRGAEAALGPRFDVRQFHDRVLESGRVPLSVLRESIERWIVELPLTR